MLIIDDSEDVHRLLKARLSSEGLEFLSAMNGADGLDVASERHPSLIILDLDMPGMHGLAVLKRLKDLPRTASIPVMVLSGHNAAQDKVESFELGAVDFVAKPFELTELRVRVRSAIRMQQLVQMLAQRAQIDGLTGLWNRAFFDQRWSEEHARAQRRGHPLSVAILDLDHFKLINDTFGHPAGDIVLQTVARTIQRVCRTSDLACRYGGEEFVLLMPDTASEDAYRLCDRVRSEIEAIGWPANPALRVTVSIGVAGASTGVAGASSDWVEQADRNLYAAKRAGRNLVVMTDLTDDRAGRARTAG